MSWHAADSGKVSIVMKKIIFLLVVLSLLVFSGCSFLDSVLSDSVSLEPSVSSGLSVSEGSDGLTVYFIDVGQGDSVLIVCDGESMLIDGGGRSSSSLIYSFLEKRGITHLDYIVATHGHEDHIGGLSGALNYATVGVAFSPVTEYASQTFSNFVKYLGERNVEITVPSHGDVYSLGCASFKILGPVLEKPDTNNSSIIIKLTYGNTGFLFTGDAERESEQAVLDAGYDISADVLYIGHHGSDTSTIYPFLREVMPSHAVISVGAGNSYGHPHENTLSRLRDADVQVFRTDLQGDIVAMSDGRSILFSPERNDNVQTNPTGESRVSESDVLSEPLVGNVNSLKFHLPSCSNLPAEHNRILFDDYDDAIKNNYEPCGSCKPTRQ